MQPNAQVCLTRPAEAAGGGPEAAGEPVGGCGYTAPLPASFIGGCVNGCKVLLAQGDTAILHCHWLASLTVTS